MTQSISLIIIGLVLAAACVPGRDRYREPPQTVARVDLARYAGEWYEISRYPNRFQEDCPASKATYSLRPEGGIKVLNECYDLEYHRVIRSVQGKARVVDHPSNARLKVTFFWPFSGNYWIIDLGDDYEYAVVGHPARKYLWILSRSPQMPDSLYARILDRLVEQGYEPDKLIRRENSYQ